MDRQEILRHRYPRIRLEKRRHDQHAARPRPPRRTARLRAGCSEGLRGRHDRRPHQVRRLLRRHRPRELVLHPALRRHLRRPPRPHLPRLRRLPRRQGGGDARRRRDRRQRPPRAALFSRLGAGPHDDPLCLARLHDGGPLLPHFHPHLPQGGPPAPFHRLLARHRRAAALHPPQEHQTAARGNRIEDLHLETAQGAAAERRTGTRRAPRPTQKLLPCYKRI